MDRDCLLLNKHPIYVINRKIWELEMDIENRLRELLMPVLGIADIEEIQLRVHFVNDLGAESIDFVEISLPD